MLRIIGGGGGGKSYEKSSNENKAFILQHIMEHLRSGRVTFNNFSLAQSPPHTLRKHLTPSPQTYKTFNFYLSVSSFSTVLFQGISAHILRTSQALSHYPISSPHHLCLTFLYFALMDGQLSTLMKISGCVLVFSYIRQNHRPLLTCCNRERHSSR